MNKKLNKLKIFGGKLMNTGYVITNDGIRMTYEEYIQMVKSERD